jgi:hypothetical protein
VPPGSRQDIAFNASLLDSVVKNLHMVSQQNCIQIGTLTIHPEMVTGVYFTTIQSSQYTTEKVNILVDSP